jgi:hypothetical protein
MLHKEKGKEKGHENIIVCFCYSTAAFIFNFRQQKIPTRHENTINIMPT